MPVDENEYISLSAGRTSCHVRYRGLYLLIISTKSVSPCDYSGRNNGIVKDTHNAPSSICIDRPKVM
jgi:hypothetical protein